MTLRKTKYIGAIVIFVLCFIFHFTYEMFPNFIFSIFFPVNESIFEHMKLIFSSILCFELLQYFIFKKYAVSYNNLFLSAMISSSIGVISYLLVFIPIYYKIGGGMFLFISIMIFSIIVSQFVSYYILNFRKLKALNVISVVIILIIYTISTYFTYNPVLNSFFYDSDSEIYGIKK